MYRSIILVFGALLIQSVIAAEYPSPKGEYTVIIEKGSDGAVSAKVTNRKMADLGVLWTFEEIETRTAVLWSPDGTQVAIYGEAGRSGETKVFQIGNDRFHEFLFPEVELPSVAQKTSGRTARAVYGVVKPLRWTKQGNLVVQKDGRLFLPGQDDRWLDYSAEAVLKFDLKDDGSVVSVSKVKVKERTGLE